LRFVAMNKGLEPEVTEKFVRRERELRKKKTGLERVGPVRQKRPKRMSMKEHKGREGKPSRAKKDGKLIASKPFPDTINL